VSHVCVGVVGVVNAYVENMFYEVRE